MFGDQKRARLQHEHPRAPLQRLASGTLVDLGSGECAVHPGPDNDHVEAEPALLLRFLYFVNGVAHEPGEGIQPKSRLLDIRWAGKGPTGVYKLPQHVDFPAVLRRFPRRRPAGVMICPAAPTEPHPLTRTIIV